MTAAVSGRPKVSLACLNARPGCHGCGHPRHDARIAPRNLEAAGRFGTIVVDPPWTYTHSTRTTEDSGNGWRSPGGRHYSTMKLSEIKALPVPAVAADDAVLALWSVNALMRQAYQVVETWGFEPKTMLTWAKTTRDGSRPNTGMGFWLRGATEHIVIAVKGRPKPLRRNVPSWFAAPVQRHSQKPDEAYSILETLLPGPHIDVFARSVRQGWTVWGDEVWS